MSDVISITDQSFHEEVLKSSLPVLVDFWATWCGPCKALAPVLDEIATELKESAKIVKIEIQENPLSAPKYGVKALPTLLVFKEGKVVDQLVGNQSKANIVEILKKHL